MKSGAGIFVDTTDELTCAHFEDKGATNFSAEGRALPEYKDFKPSGLLQGDEEKLGSLPPWHPLWAIAKMLQDAQDKSKVRVLLTTELSDPLVL